MDSNNTLKVIVAFLAGLVIALGGALIYVQSSKPDRTVQQAAAVQPVAGSAQAQPIQTTPVAASTAEAPVAPQPVQAARVEPARVEPAHVEPPVSEPKPVHKERAAVKKHRVPRAVNDEDAQAGAPQAPPPDPVQVAQNMAPAAPPPPAPVQTAQPEPQAQPAPPPPPPQPQVVTLQPGTTLSVRLGETLSSDHNYTGDTFRATLQSPIVRNGYIIADRGSQVLGRVADSEKAGRVKGLANLTLELTAINTTDGQRIHIQTNTTNIQGPSSRKRDVAEIAGGSALGAIIGAIAGGGKGAAIGAGAGGAAGAGGTMATRGKAAVVQAETPLTFHLNAPVTITEKLNQ